MEKNKWMDEIHFATLLECKFAGCPFFEKKIRIKGIFDPAKGLFTKNCKAPSQVARTGE